MIGSLRGKIESSDGERVIVDVNGVGYQVTVSSAVLDGVELPGEEVQLLIYTDVRENDISLFGFRERSEKEVFLLLKKVKGVGSRLAMGIVSALPAVSLLRDIAEGNVQSLTRIPGIGKKTAERIIVELGEGVSSLVEESSRERRPGAASQTEPLRSTGEGDAVLALERLGFRREQAEQAVHSAVQKHGPVTDAGELVKEALRCI